jgi:hypothetical protein
LCQALQRYLRRLPRLKRMMLPWPNWACNAQSGLGQALSLTGLRGMSGTEVVSRVAQNERKQYHASHFETR